MGFGGEGLSTHRQFEALTLAGVQHPETSRISRSKHSLSFADGTPIKSYAI
jgi:hypothetical protein